MSDASFLKRCRGFRDSGYNFLGLQSNCDHVTYLFEHDAEIVSVKQGVEDNGVPSIAQIFPLADFAERQMFRECGIKAFGNINLLPPQKKV